MRGARLFIWASMLSCGACSGVSHPSGSLDPAPSRLQSDPGFRIEFPEALPPQDQAPGGGAGAEPAPARPAPTAGVVKTNACLLYTSDAADE